jgi:hypothetical protein
MNCHSLSEQRRYSDWRDSCKSTSLSDTNIVLGAKSQESNKEKLF